MWFASRKHRLERRAARAFGLKDYPGAVRALEELLQLVGENPNTLHVLAVCRQRQGDFGAAIIAAERGIAADPRHVSCLKLLVEVHAAREEMDSARRYALRALELLDAPAPTPGGIVGVVERIAGRRSPRTGSDADEREWSRWARALCQSDADKAK